MMSASVDNPPDCLIWQDALAAKYNGNGRFGLEEWDALLGHCQAVCDWLAAAFAKELIEAYPAAKVVLTTRDVDSWHASAKRTCYWRTKDPELRFLSKFDWASGLYYPMLRRLWDCFFSHDFEKNGKDVFRKHYQEVRDLVPPENLLEYQVGMGWEPLCKFLGHHVPPTPFPRLNDTEDFVNRCRKRKRAQWMNIVFRMFCMASMVFAAGIFVLQLMHKYVFK